VQSFFAVYDGHGGRATVNFVVKSLHCVWAAPFLHPLAATRTDILTVCRLHEQNFEQQILSFPNRPIAEAFKQAYVVRTHSVTTPPNPVPVPLLTSPFASMLMAI
jgi:hypothetical protein